MQKPHLRRFATTFLAALICITAPRDAQGFVHASGADLLTDPGGPTLKLRGINNVQALWLVIGGTQWVLEDPLGQGIPEYERLSASMFTEMSSLGMNVVRLGLNYRYFEDDTSPGTYKQEAWDMLDRAVNWSKLHGMYLTLAMVVPPGGFQPSGGGGAALWNDPTMQTRLSDLWFAIASRYRNEPTISGFDLLNEPNPTVSATQWASLAQRLVDRIRTVDPNHLIIVEKVNWIVAANGSIPPDDGAPWLFLVNDSNVMYDVHFYDIFSYTQQLVGQLPLWGSYPDPNKQFFDHSGNFLGVWNRTYLESLVDQEASFGELNGVPMNIGEWGAGVPSFTNQLGALQYTQDLGEILAAKGLNYTYFTYDRIFFEPWRIAQSPILGTIKSGLVGIFQQLLLQRTLLSADKGSVSIAAGGTVTFTVRDGPGPPSRVFVLLGSASGSSPGLTLRGLTLPLNPDGYFRWTSRQLNSAYMPDSPGFLGPAGDAPVRLVLPPGLPASLAGLTLRHAVYILDASSGALWSTSNAIPLDLKP